MRLTIRGKRTILGTYDSEEEAEQQRAAALSIVEHEVCDGITLQDHGNNWLERREVGRLVVDPDSDWGRWRNHVQGTDLAKLPVPMIRRRHVKDWLLALRAKELSRSSILNTLNLVRGALGAALDDELIKVNPAVGVKVPKQKRTEDEWTHLTPDEQATTISIIKGPERWIAGFAMGTGLRAGELVSLREKDVANGEIVVRFGTPPSEPTKGGRIRRIPILPPAADALERWRAERGTRLRKPDPNGLLFPRVMGGFRDPDHVLRWNEWTPVSKAVGRRIRWHDLRHTCAASLLRGWWGRRWSLEELCALLGHADIATTQRYAHLADDILGQAATETRIGRESVLSASAALAKTTTIPMCAPETTRTSDQRFRKSPVGAAESNGYSGLDQKATSLLRAIAEGDPTALAKAVDLAESVLTANRDIPELSRNDKASGGAS